MPKKYVDESWKDNVKEEKDLALDGSQKAEDPDKKLSETPDPSDEKLDEAYEANFFNYISSLALQTLIFLGEIPNPMADNKRDVNLKQAKFLIDTLLMLKEKTKGNLEQPEEQLLQASLYELELKYVERSKEKTVN